jgi:paired amphipathic helix protein Sin3a
VLRRVTELFKDQPDLRAGFRVFLPPGTLVEDLPEAAAATNVSRDNSGSKLAVVGKQPVTVTNALEYLEQVKSRCPPGDYNVFLDIMKAFKAQTADTKEVLRRVTELFKDQPDLRAGFRVFLPPGFQQ